MNLDSRYAEYFPYYSSCFVRALIFLKYMYEMTNSENLFADELTEWLIEPGLINTSIDYKYAPDGTKIVVLFYVDDCVY